MSKISIKGKGILFETRDELLYVEPYGENCARVRSTRNSKLSDERWTLMEPEPDSSTVEYDGEVATLKNGKLTVKVSYVWGYSRVEFLRNGETVLASREESDPATKYAHVEGDHYRIRASFQGKDEHIYGLGQEQQSYFDRKGCTYDILHRNTKSTVPVIYSSLGYGFLWNNPATGQVEFGLKAHIRQTILFLSEIRLPKS